MEIITATSPMHYLPSYLHFPPSVTDLQFAEAAKAREYYSSDPTTILQVCEGMSRGFIEVILAMLPTPVRNTHVDPKKYVASSVIIVADDRAIEWRNMLVACTSLEEGRDYAIVGNRHIETWPLRRVPLFYVMTASVSKRLMRGITFKRVIVDSADTIVRERTSLPNGLHTHLVVYDYRKLIGNNCVGLKFLEKDRSGVLLDPITDCLVTT